MNESNVAQRLHKAEGRIRHMYKCTGGVVTVGVGHAIGSFNDARAFRFMVDGRAATDAEIRADFETVAAAPKGMVAEHYEGLTRCRLPEDEIDRIVSYDIGQFTRTLKGKLPYFASLPDPAQEALFDIGFNCGVAGLLKFKKLLAAVQSKNWTVAATESHRGDIGDDRNKDIADLFLKAA
jgi:GH24 family phage-related lysozyme (muramidase)